MTSDGSFATMRLPFQVVGQKYLDRKKHVWYKRPPGDFKCVICGGVTKVPTQDDLPDRFEVVSLTEEAMCPGKVVK